ncbi:MAG: 50S ribosomal protein L29 [Spirochaetia bacterium]|nr:50S ribosomal protein L29 [Spirochaetia bacterium]
MGTVYHEMTDEELTKQLELAKAEMRELRFTYATARSLPDPSRIGNLKRNVARILTVRSERTAGKATVKPKSEKTAKKLEKEAKQSKGGKGAEKSKAKEAPKAKAEPKEKEVKATKAAKEPKESKAKDKAKKAK